MPPSMPYGLPRRQLLGTILPTVLAAPALGQTSHAQTVNFLSWSSNDSVQAALREQIASFTLASGLRVAQQQFPWGTYRTALLSRMVNDGPADVIWLSDAWLPEFVEAGWVRPINDIQALTRFAPETRGVCLRSMSYRSEQYGLGYYTDNMAFLYNKKLLERAGFAEPPTSWNEVVQQAQVMRQRGLVAHPLGLPLAPDPWLIEIISTLVFSFGGGFIGPAGDPVMAERPETRAALQFLHHISHHEGIVAHSAATASENEVTDAFGQGLHAFAVLPTYRLRMLNNRAMFAEAGNFRVALMPNGGDAQEHQTCGWVRMYALTAGAAGNLQRLRNAVAFMEAFGGKDHTGQFAMAKRLLFRAGLPFCPTTLYQDPQVIDYVTEWTRGGNMVLRAQVDTVRNKDTISPWFGNWQSLTNPLWQGVCLGTLSAETALQLAAEIWSGLQRARN